MSLKRELFREPRGGRLFWFMMAYGCFNICLGVTAIFWRDAPLTEGGFVDSLHNLSLGLMFSFWSISELLPRERRAAIAALRAGFLAFSLSTCALVVLMFYELTS